MGLFIDLELPKPSGKAFSEDRKRQAIIVNGASSAVGGFVVQLGKIAGYTVVGIAGQGGDYVKKLGADRLIDYRGKSNANVARLVKAAVQELGSERVAVFDAIATAETASMLANHVMQPEGGKITVLNPVLVEDLSKP
jgi:NADPH:quinone reductase-like Zn-dependent oxidoreductase